MPARTPHLNSKTIAVIGLGQIGGSILKRLALAKPRLALMAHDRDRRLAAKVARYSEWVTSLQDIVAGADVVILATPVPAIVDLMGQIAELRGVSRRRLLLLDTGTVKQAVAKEAARYKRQLDYIGLHPLAGNEGEGWGSSRGDLFVGKQIVCTPPVKARNMVARDLVRLLGATLLPMDVRTHDRFVAEAIGLPHILAFAAMGISNANPLRAGSWASLTRVAASNPEMVAGFLRMNSSEQKVAIARFEKELALIKRALADPSGTRLRRFLTDRQRAGE